MPDIFDEIAPDQSPAGDIFDQVAPAPEAISKPESLWNSAVRGIKTMQALPDVAIAAGTAGLDKPTIRQERKAFVSAMSDPMYQQKLMEAGDNPQKLRQVETTRGPAGRLDVAMTPQRALQTESVRDLAAAQSEIAAIPTSPAQQRLASAKTSREKWGAWLQDPVELTAGIVLESLPPSVAGATVGTIVGGPGVGTAAGAGMGSAAMTFSSEFLGAANQQGVDITNPDQLEAFLNNKPAFDQAFNVAVTKSAIVGGVDASTAGLAGRWIVPALKLGLKQRIIAAGKEMGMQMAGGAGGEAAGQVASGQPLDTFDIGMEALAEVATAPGEVAGNLMAKRATPVSVAQKVEQTVPPSKPDIFDQVASEPQPQKPETASNSRPPGTVATPAPAGASQQDQVRSELAALPGAERDLVPKNVTPPDQTPATKADLVALATFIEKGGPNPFAQREPDQNEMEYDGGTMPRTPGASFQTPAKTLTPQKVKEPQQNQGEYEGELTARKVFAENSTGQTPVQQVTQDKVEATLAPTEVIEAATTWGAAEKRWRRAMRQDPSDIADATDAKEEAELDFRMLAEKNNISQRAFDTLRARAKRTETPDLPRTARPAAKSNPDIFDQVAPEPAESEMDYGAGGAMPRTAAASLAGPETVQYPQFVYRARKLMEQRFTGLKRRGGDLASEHVHRVADMTNDPVLKTIAYLHDIVEDTPTSVEEVRALFGDRVAEAVQAETWNKDAETYDHYIERLMKNQDAAKSKLLDIADNLETSKGWGDSEFVKGKQKQWTETAARLQRLVAGLPDVMSTLRRRFMPDGVTLRHQWRQDQIHKVVAAMKFPHSGTKPTAVFSGGGAAAGKSTLIKILRKSGAVPDDANMTISADDYKTGDDSVAAVGAEGIPEFKTLVESDSRKDAAFIVHKESTTMAKATLGRGVSEGRSLIYDATMSDHTEDWSLAEAAVKAGYDVTLMGVYLDENEAVKRAHIRAEGDPATGRKGTGRHVPEEHIRGGHRGFAKSFPRYLQLFPKVFLFDNNRDRDPRLIVTKDENGVVIHDAEAYIKFAGQDAYEAAKSLENSTKKPVTQDADAVQSGGREGGDGRGQRQVGEQAQAQADSLAGELSNDRSPTTSEASDGGAGRSESGAVDSTGGTPGVGAVSDGEDPGVQTSVRAGNGRKAKGSGVSSDGELDADVSGVSDGQAETNADAATETDGGDSPGSVRGGALSILPGERRRPNLRLTESVAPTGAVARIKANIGAIKTLRSIEQDSRTPSDEDISIMAQWSGWGSFKELFNSGKAERREWDQGWQKKYGKFYDQLRELLSEEEFNAAAESSVNAHFTSKQVVDWNWAAARRLGFKGGRALEPGAGIGFYMGYMPADLADATQWTAVELDQITGKLLAMLYPETDTRVQGFEEAKLPNGGFTLATSNVPFHEIGPGKEYPDLNLHNYFLARMLDKVKPGGLVMAITTKNTMEARPRQRELLASKGQLVAAIRLPNNAFKESADTEVVTDLLILRRPDGKPFEGQRWLNQVNVAEEGQPPILVNEYFAAHPEMVLGKHALTGSMYGKDEYTVESTGSLQAHLDRVLQLLPENILTETVEEESTTTTRDEYSIYVNRDGQVVESRNYTENLPLWDSSSPALVATAKAYIRARDTLTAQYKLERTAEVPAADIEANRKKLRTHYKALRAALGGKTITESGRKLKHLETDPDFYTVLGLEYTEVVKNDDDPTATKEVIHESDVLSKRVGKVDSAPDRADNASEALGISMAYKGGMDLAYIQELTGMPEDAIADELMQADLAYLDVDTGKLVTRNEYLSGDIRDKYAKAIFATKEDQRYARNVEALKKVIPATDPFGKIKLGIEARWVPVAVQNAFAKEVMGLNGDEVRFVDKTQEFAVTGSDRYGRQSLSEKARVDYSTAKRGALELLESALNMQTVRITETRDKKVYVDEEGSKLANDVVTKIKDDFAKWIRTTEARVEYRSFDSERGEYRTEALPVWDVLEREWNRKKNSFVSPEYDGTALKLPGVTDWFWRKQHILDGVQRGIQQGSCVYAYGVGSGKTALITILGRELKRIGLSKKGVFVVKKPTVGQFRTTIEQLYPGSRVLIPSETDFQAKNRRKFISRLAAGNFDFIVMTHENMKSIRPSEQGVQDFFNEKIDELRQVLVEMGAAKAEFEKNTRGMSREVANIVKKIKTLKKQLDKNLTSMRKHQDKGIAWEDLGIDALHIDESHNFKNIPITTQLNDVKGVPSSFSQRATDLMIKVRDVQKRTNGRGIYFYTGTPVSNTLAELWGQIHVTNPKVLDDMGVKTFDAFATAFAETTTNFEFGWDNKFKEVTRMAKFKNGAALTTLTRMGISVKIGNEELGLDVPKMKGGGPQIKVTPVNPEFQRWLDMLEDVSAEWDSLDPKGRFDNSWVAVTAMKAGAAAALDPRCIFPDAQDHPDSKVNVAVRDIFSEWEAGKAKRTTMMVFADMYRTLNTDKLRGFVGGEHAAPPAAAEPDTKIVTDLDAAETEKETEDPGDNGAADEAAYEANAVGDFNLYHDIRAKLVKLGVPEHEIGVITEHNSDTKRDALFDKVRAGQVRILLGSTEKIGEGVDVPQRMSREFHLDPPSQMTAAKMDQRIGRIIRQGNLHSPKNWNAEVEVTLYAQERSMDAPIYNLMMTKGKMTLQALKGQFLGDEFEDPASEVTASMAALIAQATGDTRALELAKLTEEVRKLTQAENAYFRQLSDVQRTRDRAESDKKHAKAVAKDMTELATAAKDATADKDTLTMSAGDKTRTGAKEIQESLDRVAKSFESKLEKIDDTISIVLRFGKNLYAGLRGTAVLDYNAPKVKDAPPAIKRVYTVDFTVADREPDVTPYGLNTPKYTMKSELGSPANVYGVLQRLADRAESRAKENQETAAKQEREQEVWAKKLTETTFDKTAELKEKRAEMDRLQGALMGNATRSQKAQMRVARKKGLLLDVDKTVPPIEAEREQIRRDLAEDAGDPQLQEQLDSALERFREAQSELAQVPPVDESLESWQRRSAYREREDKQRSVNWAKDRVDQLRARMQDQAKARTEPKLTRLATIEKDLLKWLNDAIKATDYDPTKVMEGVLGAPVWLTRGAANAALRAIRKAIQAGRSIATAINEALDVLQGQNLAGFNEAEARTYLEAKVQRTYTSEQNRQTVKSAFDMFRSPETKLELMRLERQRAAEIKAENWPKVRELNDAMNAVFNAEDRTGNRVNVDQKRTPEETAGLISDTVEILNTALDAQMELRSRGQEVPADLTQLVQDLKTRLNMLKGWTDAELENLTAAPATPAPPRDGRFAELESATNPDQANLGDWWGKVKLAIRHLTSPIPELPLTGARASTSAVFRRGYRMFAVENNRVRLEAADKVNKVVEPLVALGRTPADNDALARYFKLGSALQRAKMDPAKTATIRAKMDETETVLNRDPFNLFRRLVLYRDLWWRGTFLKNETGDPITLPMDLTVEDVAAELRRLTGAIEQHPDGLAITEALRRHYALTEELQQSILAHGEIIPESLRNPLYFPHHMIDSWSGRLDRVRPKTEEDFRRYLITPQGSGKLIQTDYLKAMYLHTADVLAHNARVDLVDKYWKPYDISEQLRAQHGEKWNKPWNLPPGFKIFTPFKKLPLRMDYILSREFLAEKLGVMFNDGDLRKRLEETGGVLEIRPEDLHKALTAGEKIQWALPEEIANALDGIAKREAASTNPGLGHAIGLPFRAVNTFWKKVTLFAPWNWLRYEYGNLSTDAVDKVLAADPAQAKFLGRAARELWTADQGNQSPEFRAAQREGVFDTITAAEAGELTRLPQFKAFMTGGEVRWDNIRTVLASPMRGSAFREGVFRYAKFLADLERLQSGKEAVYAGAFHGDVEALGDSIEMNRPALTGMELLYAKAAEISLKTYGDYNQLGVAGQWLRQYAVPFWSWQDVNFRYHANQLRNLADGLTGDPRQVTTARKAALRYAGIRVVSTLLAIGIAKELWNQFGGPLLGLWDDDDELEGQLSAQDRRRGHLLLGKDANGKAMVVYTPSAFSDVAEWTGGQNMKRLFMEWTRGQITLGQFITDYAKQLPADVINKAAQSVGPLGKAPYEAISGKATFPDVLDQRNIPAADKWWRLVGTLTDQRVTGTLRAAFDQDYYSQPATEQLQQIILQIRRRDPEQWAYYEAREDAADWKETKTGKRFEQGSYDAPEAQALRNFRKSIYRGDVANAERFYTRLLEFGYTAERLDASIRNQDPLSDLNQSERAVYLNTITPRQRQELALAQKYYGRMKALDNREKQLFPKKGQSPNPNPQLLKRIVEDQSRNK